MNENFERRCKSLVNTLGLCRADEVTAIERLTGGVASDIASLSFGDKTICIKFALPKLKVEEDWFAPVHRNKAEYAWLNFAREISPTTTPKLYGWSEAENGFAMEFISGANIYLWKSELLNEAPQKGEAKAVANVIGLIHSASARADSDRRDFDNMSDFEALRIEPYLRFTASQHKDIETQILAMADQLSKSATALVHGDVSPKNILIRNGQPILLDAECATMGDPCFDVAFCLNHLLLKSIHLPNSRDNLLEDALSFWDAYKSHIDWEDADDLEVRVATLLPMLMLARVDGKSPVEYLSDGSKAKIRQITRPLIQTPVNRIAEILNAIRQGASS